MGKIIFEKRDDRVIQVQVIETELDEKMIDNSIEAVTKMIENANRRIMELNNEQTKLDELIKQWQDDIKKFEVQKAEFVALRESEVKIEE